MTNFNMMDSPTGTDPKRLLLAVVATSAVLMLYSYFFPPTQPVPVAEQVEKKPVIATKPSEVAIGEDNNRFASAHEHATGILPEKISTFSVTDQAGTATSARTSYAVDISSVGGSIERYVLSDFRQESVIFDNHKLNSSLFSLSSREADRSFDASSSYEILSQDKNSIRLRHVTKQGLAIERHYQFLQNASMTEAITFKNLSDVPVRVSATLSAVKRDAEKKESSFLNPGVSAQSLAVKTGSGYERIAYADLLDKPKNFSSLTYFAFDDQFFLAAMVPKYVDAIEDVKLVVTEQDKLAPTAHIDVNLKSFVLLRDEEKILRHEFFIGPKQIDLLAAKTPPLDENIDFGWFGVLARPMLWLLVQINGLINNYGIAIILLTLVIKLLTYPLTQKSFSSQAAMKKLQPKIEELKQKYGHDRTMFGQKQLELFREHGINPLAGCLPLLIQLPIWFAFFQMLRNSVELFDQPFYWWITDLTRPDQYYVLPILMGVSMLIQQAFTPPPAEQPHMKYVMWTMPIFLTFIMLNMPSGLSLYLLTNNLLTIGQQIIIKRQSERINA